MITNNPIYEAYFNAIRADDIETARRLLHETPDLVHARWKGRGRPDGKMRSLGPTPYNQHTWIDAPVNLNDPDDPRYTSAPLIYTQNDAMVRLLVERGPDVNSAHAAALGWTDWIKGRLVAMPDLANWHRPFVPLLTGAATFDAPFEASRRHGRIEIIGLLTAPID